MGNAVFRLIELTLLLTGNTGVKLIFSGRVRKIAVAGTSGFDGRMTGCCDGAWLAWEVFHCLSHCLNGVQERQQAVGRRRGQVRRGLALNSERNQFAERGYFRYERMSSLTVQMLLALKKIWKCLGSVRYANYCIWPSQHVTEIKSITKQSTWPCQRPDADVFYSVKCP